MALNYQVSTQSNPQIFHEDSSSAGSPCHPGDHLACEPWLAQGSLTSRVGNKIQKDAPSLKTPPPSPSDLCWTGSWVLAFFQYPQDHPQLQNMFSLQQEECIVVNTQVIQFQITLVSLASSYNSLKTACNRHLENNVLYKLIRTWPSLPLLLLLSK